MEQQAPILTLSDLQVIVLGSNHCWGKGDTVEQARKNAERPKKYLVYVVHPDTTVGGLGEMIYPRGFKPLLIERKGIPETKPQYSKEKCTHQGKVIRNRICSGCGEVAPKKEVRNV